MVDPSVKGNNTYGVHNNSQGSFNPLIGQPNTLSQPFGQQTSFNPLIGQPHILNQSLEQQNVFNSPMGQSNYLSSLGQINNLNDPLSQHIQPNMHNLVQSNSFYQPKSFGQSSNLNQQPTFQPIQSNLNTFSQVIPPSSNFYSQKTPSGKIKYLFI